MRSSDVVVREPTLDDIDPLFAIYGDAETWRHLPQGRFTERTAMASMVEAWMAEWADVGLSSWVVETDGHVVGSCGVMPRVGWWNLGFRLSPAVWGRGLAARIASDAVRAGQTHRLTWPVVARSLVTNPASGRVSERAGLRRVWTGPCGPSVVEARIDRVIHADRALDDELLTAIRALG